MAISVEGRNFRGRQAPPGQVWVVKDGTLLLRPEDNPTPEGNFRDILEQAGQGEFTPLFEGFRESLLGTMPELEQFRPRETSEFREQAERESAPFFDKSLSLANKAIQQAREQIKEQAELAQRFQDQEEEQFFRVEDKTFARELMRAQQGFAGRGTFDSGFRGGDISQRQDVRGEGLEDAERGFQFREETRDQKLEQGFEDLDLEQEQRELSIQRQREQDILSRQRQLSSAFEQQRRAGLEGLGESFSEFLGQEGAA